jgi:L-arabinose transport system substrate-binding protein
MKRLLWVLTLLSASALLFAAGSKDAGKPAAKSEGALLAFICKDLSQEWFVGTSETMRKTAKSLGARDVLLYDCAMSPDKYMSALDSAIAQKVDVLIVCPPDQQLSQITVQRCKEAGIKVMADDDGLIDEKGVHIAPALELNAYVVGEGQGKWLADYVKTKKIDADIARTAYLCLTMSQVSSCVPRSEGAVDAFLKLNSSFPKNKIIKADYDGTSDKAFNVAAATITANPGIKTWIVTAPNDEGALGATRALEQANLDKKAVVVGIGGYLAVDEFKKDFSCFMATAYIDPISDGTIAATAAMKWITDGAVPYQEYAKPGMEFGVYPFGAVMVSRFDDFSMLE